MVPAVAAIVIPLIVEGEEVHEIADSRPVFGRISVIIALMDRVRQIVAAAIRDLGKIPVLFDELQHRGVVVIGMVDVTLLSVGRNRNERNAGAVAEEATR